MTLTLLSSAAPPELVLTAAVAWQAMIPPSGSGPSILDDRCAFGVSKLPLLISRRLLPSKHNSAGEDTVHQGPDCLQLLQRLVSRFNASNDVPKYSSTPEMECITMLDAQVKRRAMKALQNGGLLS